MTKFETKGYYYKSKNGKGVNKHLYIVVNEDGETITVRNLEGSTPPNIGMMISSHGGVFPLLAKCTKTSANFNQWQRYMNESVLNQTPKPKIKREPKMVWVKVFSTKEMEGQI